ncbi:hypothetical protein PDJAM_G00130150 [Pangasius djambal]|uniref:Uncharacterized protein n=1 Tax=Pangasius djambal TaxID=1691987 RepID=A0ACC5ZBN2_9TELE|nr:hypothetical protein [Pangasius djambal]
MVPCASVVANGPISTHQGLPWHKKMVWSNKNTPTQSSDMEVALLQGLLGRRSTVEIWTLEKEVALRRGILHI